MSDSQAAPVKIRPLILNPRSIKSPAASRAITAPLLCATNQSWCSGEEFSELQNNAISLASERASSGSFTQQFQRGKGPAEYSFLSTFTCGSRRNIQASNRSGLLG